MYLFRFVISCCLFRNFLHLTKVVPICNKNTFFKTEKRFSCCKQSYKSNVCHVSSLCSRAAICLYRPSIYFCPDIIQDHQHKINRVSYYIESILLLSSQFIIIVFCHNISASFVFCLWSAVFLLIILCNISVCSRSRNVDESAAGAEHPLPPGTWHLADPSIYFARRDAPASAPASPPASTSWRTSWRLRSTSAAIRHAGLLHQSIPTRGMFSILLFDLCNVSE